MTERERWTIYPLLFLSLGVALRGNFSPTHQLRCHRLFIERSDGTRQMELTALPTANGGGGLLKVFAEDGRVGIALQAAPQGGLVETIGPQGGIRVAGPNGVPQVVLESTPNGGAVSTFFPDGHRLFLVDPPPQGPSVTTFGPDGHPNVRLGKPWILQMRPALAAPSGDAEHR